MDTNTTHYAIINTRTGNFEPLDFVDRRYTTENVEEAKAFATMYNDSNSLPQNKTFTVVTLTFNPEV